MPERVPRANFDHGDANSVVVWRQVYVVTGAGTRDFSLARPLATDRGSLHCRAVLHILLLLLRETQRHCGRRAIDSVPGTSCCICCCTTIDGPRDARCLTRRLSIPCLSWTNPRSFCFRGIQAGDLARSDTQRNGAGLTCVPNAGGSGGEDHDGLLRIKEKDE